MFIEKDSAIRADILGIYVHITYNGDNVILTVTTNNDKLNSSHHIFQIKHIAEKYNTPYKGTIKCLLTISKNDFKKLYNQIDVNMSFEDLIIKCLLDDELINYITLLVCGTTDDIDEYDDLYECNICKYFSNFYRLPKMKLKQSIQAKDIQLLFKLWNQQYFVTSIKNLTNNTFIPISNFVSYHIITLEDIDIINKDNKLLIYITINGNKMLLDINRLFLFSNNKLPENCISMFENEIIDYNILDLLRSKIDFSKVIYKDGNLQYNN